MAEEKQKSLKTGDHVTFAVLGAVPETLAYALSKLRERLYMMVDITHLNGIPLPSPKRAEFGMYVDEIPSVAATWPHDGSWEGLLTQGMPRAGSDPSMERMFLDPGTIVVTAKPITAPPPEFALNIPEEPSPVAGSFLGNFYRRITGRDPSSSLR